MTLNEWSAKRSNRTGSSPDLPMSKVISWQKTLHLWDTRIYRIHPLLHLQFLQIFFPKNKGQKKNPWGLQNPPNMHPQSCRNHQQSISEFAEISGSTSRPGFRPQLLWPHCEADCLFHQICVHLVIPNTGKVDTLMTKSWEGPKTWNHSSSSWCKDGKLWEASSFRFKVQPHHFLFSRQIYSSSWEDCHPKRPIFRVTRGKFLRGLEPVSNLQAFHSLRASFHFIMHSNAFSSGMEMYWKTMTKHDYIFL